MMDLFGIESAGNGLNDLFLTDDGAKGTWTVLERQWQVQHFSLSKNFRIPRAPKVTGLPLLPSGPGGFERSWSYKTCLCANVRQVCYSQKSLLTFVGNKF